MLTQQSGNRSKEIAIHLINDMQKKIDEQLYLIEQLKACSKSTEEAFKILEFLLNTVDELIQQHLIVRNCTDESDLIVALNDTTVQ